MPQQPNILFLLADDMGWGDVNYNGGQADTPHLNAMASGQNSVQFSRFYSGAPVCTPTRGTVLTGRNHNRYCIWSVNTYGDCDYTNDFVCPSELPLPPSEITVAELLQNAGYRTAIFGKWHLGDLKYIEGGHSEWSPSHPGMHGFDVWKVTEQSVPTVNPNCACFDLDTCLIGHYANSIPPSACTNYHGNNITSACSESSDCPLVTHPDAILEDDSHFIVDELTTFIDDSVESSLPFFAYVSFHTPHSRYIATEDLAEKYADRGWDETESDYYGSIEGLDSAIGDILTHLEELGIKDDTMIWFTSDNGPASTAPGSTGGLAGYKGTLLEGGIRVPGIVQWPSVIQENKVSDYVVTTSDFLPTVMDITGTELSESRVLDGTSILDHLLGLETTRSSAANWAFKVGRGDFSKTFDAVSIDGDLKLHVVFKDGEVDSTALYDLSVDEETDIADSRPRKHNALLKGLKSWAESLVTSATEEVGCISDAGYFNP